MAAALSIDSFVWQSPNNKNGPDATIFGASEPHQLRIAGLSGKMATASARRTGGSTNLTADASAQRAPHSIGPTTDRDDGGDDSDHQNAQ
jgi:hypothetical protein